MTDQRYRFRLPDGQVFEAVGLAKIKRQYPNAYIEGRIEFNERGEGTLVPYRGEQPEAQEPAVQDAEPVAEGEPADVVVSEDPAPRARRQRSS